MNSLVGRDLPVLATPAEGDLRSGVTGEGVQTLLLVVRLRAINLGEDVVDGVRGTVRDWKHRQLLRDPENLMHTHAWCQSR